MAIGDATSSESKDESQGFPAEKTPEGWNDYWGFELRAAFKRLRKFRKSGGEVNRRFLAERQMVRSNDNNTAAAGGGDSRLTLFHTNIVVQQSMLFGSTPKVEVKREHDDPDDDIARVAAVMYKRILQADVEASGEDFSTALKSALQDHLIPGLGVCRLRYVMESMTVKVMNPMSLEVEDKDQIEYEDAPVEYVHWQDFCWGWCRTWTEMPWEAFKSYLNLEEAEARFGNDKARTLVYKPQTPGADKEDESHDTDMKSSTDKAEIWEVWYKKDRKVFWWAEGQDQILDQMDDPLKLDAFWPNPRPLMANLTTSLMVPKSDYSFAQDQYNDIDDLQSRISLITQAVKVVGVYDATTGQSVGRMLKEGHENELIPVDNWAMFAEKGGLKGVIDWFPVKEVVETLSTLRSMLAETIELLHQVTGMSDLLRGGNTDQYTSDGTQQIKAKLGSLRIQSTQQEFARFASDLEALKVEIMGKHFTPQSLAKQAAASFLPQADHDKIGLALQLMQSPDIKWRINIKPESLAITDYEQLKGERAEYLTAMATFLQSAGSMIQSVPESLPMLLEMMKFGMAGFRGSDVMEGMLDNAIDMAKKQPPKQDGDDGKAAEEQAKAQAEMAKVQAKTEGDLKIIQAKSQSEMQKIMSAHQSKMEQQAAKDQADNRKIMADLQADLRVIAAKLGADLDVEEAQSVMAIAEENVSHDNTMTQMAAQPKPEAKSDD